MHLYEEGEEMDNLPVFLGFPLLSVDGKEYNSHIEQYNEHLKGYAVVSIARKEGM
jgi:hypothetical protein